jgi:hypothetical protein
MSDSGERTRADPSLSFSSTAILRGVYQHNLGAASEPSFAISGSPRANCTLRCSLSNSPMRRFLLDLDHETAGAKLDFDLFSQSILRELVASTVSRPNIM